MTSSKADQVGAINELKQNYPANSEEIDNLYDLVLKSQSSKQRTEALDRDISVLKSQSSKQRTEALDRDISGLKETKDVKDADALMRDETVAIEEDISSFFQSQQGKADLNKLERYAV
jgi:thioredoxin-like negative regulator of GroEL